MIVLITFFLWLGFSVAIIKSKGCELGTIICFVVGWLVLPNEQYLIGDPGTSRWFDYMGLAIPDNGILVKPGVIAIGALMGVCCFPGWWSLTFRPRLIDFPVAGLLVSAALANFFHNQSITSSCTQLLALSLIWAVPWCIARVFLGTFDRANQILLAWAIATAAFTPIWITEFLVGPIFYEWMYGFHPYRFAGSSRYIGHRPVGFFEDGNQTGIWLSVATISGWTSLVACRDSASHSLLRASSYVNTILLLASQSLGAIVLGLAALISLAIPAKQRRWLMAAGLIGGLFLTIILCTGIVSPHRLNRDVPVLDSLGQALKSMGRASLGWRIRHLENSMQLAMENPVIGSANARWWEPLSMRPWGLWQLLLGMYGMTGAIAAIAIWIGPVLRWYFWVETNNLSRSERATGNGLALACVVMTIDAQLNSALPTAGLLMAGALANLGHAACPDFLLRIVLKLKLAFLRMHHRA